MKKILSLFICLILCCTAYSNTTQIVESGNWSATYYGNTYKTARRTANGDVFNMYAMACAAPKKIQIWYKT